MSGLVSRDPSGQKRVKRNVGDGLLLLQQVGSEEDGARQEVYHSISQNGSRDLHKQYLQ